MLKVRGSLLLDSTQVRDEGLVRVHLPWPSNVFRAEDVELEGTVLDAALDERGGALELPLGACFINPADLAEIGARNPLTATPPQKFLERIQGEAHLYENMIEEASPAQRWLYLPKKTSLRYTLDNGLRVTTPIQKQANWIMTIAQNWRDAEAGEYVVPEGAMQAAVARYLHEVQQVLCGKGGYIDRQSSAILPGTGRAVAVNDCKMPLDIVGIPRRVVNVWLKSHEFRAAYGLEGFTTEMAYDKLQEDARVLVGRQPTHRRTNLFSAKIRII